MTYTFIYLTGKKYMLWLRYCEPDFLSRGSLRSESVRSLPWTSFYCRFLKI